MLLPSLLALHVLTIDLVESVQVGQVSALDIVVQDMHPTLLVLIYVIVQVILRGRYHVSNGGEGNQNNQNYLGNQNRRRSGAGSLKEIEDQIYVDFHAKVDEIESPFDIICNICLFENEPPSSQGSYQHPSNKAE
jgi:hypothetical protein